MITKAIVRSINRAGNRCIVRMPLFETASSSTSVEAEALVSITPGFFNNIFVGDVVFVSFEENALEKPIILGKLYRGASNETTTQGGMGILDTLSVNNYATIPATTLYNFKTSKNDYKDFNTPKKVADYIKWLEKHIKSLFTQLEEHFICFKNWAQWQLKAENVEVDDGDLDDNKYIEVEPCLYQFEGEKCKICDKECPKNNYRKYLKLNLDEEYPTNLR